MIVGERGAEAIYASRAAFVAHAGELERLRDMSRAALAPAMAARPERSAQRGGGGVTVVQHVTGERARARARARCSTSWPAAPVAPSTGPCTTGRAASGSTGPGMPDVMMAIGFYQFGVDTAAYQELTRRNEYRWAAQERIGTNPQLQRVGTDEELEVRGYVPASLAGRPGAARRDAPHRRDWAAPPP